MSTWNISLLCEKLPRSDFIIWECGLRIAEFEPKFIKRLIQLAPQKISTLLRKNVTIGRNPHSGGAPLQHLNAPSFFNLRQATD